MKRSGTGLVVGFVLSLHLIPAALADVSPSRLVPIVLDVFSGSAHFTTEVTFTNRGSTRATVHLLYTASIGTHEGSGTVSFFLGAGAQRIVPDVVQLLRNSGLRVPSGTAGQQGGTLLVTFEGASSTDAVAVIARTTTPTAAPLPVGSAGLAYAGLQSSEGSSGPLTVFGLRSNDTDRSNVAVFATSATPVTVRLTAVSGSGDGTRVILADALSLGAYGWAQLSFGSSGLSNGWVVVERVGGTGTFSAYGVVNDNATNDGSFVAPRGGTFAPGTLTVPVVVETGGFTSELTLSNAGTQTATFTLTYAEGLSPAEGAGGTMSLALPAGTQRILPNAVDFLRQNGVAVGPSGAAAYAGALRVVVDVVALQDAYAGARTSSLASASGLFGVFTPPVVPGSEATLEAFVDGLHADALNRSNLAMVNLGSSGSITLEAQIYDGDAAGKAVGDVFSVTLPPLGWTQVGSILSARGVANGWARVRRVDGGERWIAYGVVNDGGQPGERTGDGAYVPMTLGAIAAEDHIVDTSWSVAAGETLRVARDLIVETTQDIDIAGTLLVPSDVTVRLLAGGNLTVRGTIQPDSSAIAAESGIGPEIGPGPFPLAAPPAFRGGCSPYAHSGVMVIAGTTVSITGDVYVPAGMDLIVAGVSRSSNLTDWTGTIIVKANLRTAPGRAARRRGECGESSGAIEVGTGPARATVNNAINAGQKFLYGGAVGFTSAELTGVFASGIGGPGWTDAVGVKVPKTATYLGSRGGDSGLVYISARYDCQIGPGTQLQSGNAGDAGSVRSAFAPQGSGRGDKGWNLVAELDGTAVPGNAQLQSCDTSPGRPQEIEGKPGRAGDLTGSAGSGAPEGAGGDTTILVFGRAGSINLDSGGRGGESDTPGVNGANGGTIRIAAPAAATVDRLSVSAYASGGSGFDGCGASPKTGGTSGGNASSAAFSNVTIGVVEVSGSVNGGNGGNGVGGGAGGGAAGSIASFRGNPGAPGGDCPPETDFSVEGFYPMGGVYNYRYSGAFTLDYSQTVLAPIPIPGGIAPLVAVTVIPLENRGTDGLLESRSFISIDTEGLKEYGTDYYDNKGQVSQQLRYTPPFLLPKGLASGQSITQQITQTQVNIVPPATSTQTYTLKTTFTGIESVTVPAGTFAGAQRIDQLFTTPTQTSSRTRWLVTSVGQVKDSQADGTNTLQSYTLP